LLVTTVPRGASTALLTDRYEFTMLTAALRSGAAGRRAVFEVFARALPHGRRYGVVAGTGRLLEALQEFRFGPDELAIASAASRMVNAADERPIIEMGGRRTHEMAAVASARAAYIGGFSSTSNLEAGRDYGIPTSGTSAHAFSLVHDSERDAFAAQLTALGKGTTLLVDTFDVGRAVRTAVELAGPGLGAVRIDSGDLPMVARQVRDLLDELGARDTRIVLSGDLNEYSIAALAAAPVDGYGVGTSLVTGSGAPTAALVYKLVARAREDDGEGTLQPVAKRSVGKPGRGGRKWAFRQFDEDGVASAELITRADRGPTPDLGITGTGAVRQRALLRPLVRGGEIVGQEPLDAARERHRTALAELPVHALQLSRGYPAIPTVFVPPDDE
jgi:nicotinate phosphoribosyltransferase